MVNVLSAIEISCPLEKVAAYSANPDNAPEWCVNIKSAEWLTSKPMEVGTKIAFMAHFLGRKLAYTYKITEFIPLKKLVMQTSDGPFEMKTTYTWEPSGAGSTHMTLRNEGNPKGFSKLLVPFMVPAMKRANKKDLKKLKQILENKSDVSKNQP